MRERFGFAEGLCPVAEDASDRSLALPFFTAIEAADQERVVEALAGALPSGAVPDHLVALDRRAAAAPRLEDVAELLGHLLVERLARRPFAFSMESKNVIDTNFPSLVARSVCP